MTPAIALAAFAFGIAGLFFLDRDPSVRTSKALWLPVMWVWIIGSRPVSSWLGISSGTQDSQRLDGSPVDRAIFLVLLIAGILVLANRSRSTRVFLRASWPILIYFAYCLVSVLWSDFPDIAFKRWSKALGDLVMVLIIVTDGEPRAALKRFFTRTGFILLPISLLLNKYFERLGRIYEPYTGEAINTGVSVDKNLLGVTILVLSLGALWRIVALRADPHAAHRGRHLLAQSTLLAFGVTLFARANSATSTVCFLLGAALVIATGSFRSARPARVHLLVFGFFLAALLTASLGGEETILHALGRQTDLTGRVEIWDAVTPLAPNPLVGAGFESFWLGPRVETLRQMFPVLHLNEAHDGYLEIYLNLGWVGVGLIALVLINGYRRAAALIHYDAALGSLMVSYVVIAAVYSTTEAGFRMLDCIWFFLLLAVAASDALAWQESEKQEIRYVSENEPPVLAAEAAAKPVYRALREEN